MNNTALLSRARGSASEYKRIYDQASQLVKIGAWECNLKNEELIWTDGVYDLFELPRGSTLARASIVDLYFDDSRRQMQRMRADAIRRGGSFTLDAQIRTAGNKSRWMRLSAQAIHQHGRPVRIFGAKQDITHEKELWDHLKQLADQDSLTGLANRRVFEERCNDLIKRDINDGSIAALALIDLDHFDRTRSNGYGNNWKIGTISYGLASEERVDRVAAQTQAKVCPHYDLLEDQPS